MNILPKAIFLGSLLSLLSTHVVWAEPADSYMDALSGEAGKTSMKDDDTVKSISTESAKSKPDEEEPKPKKNTETTDNDKLTDQVSQQLEKLLVGTSGGDVKQADLANIVSDAVQAGHEIDNIHDAVTNAMTELREKEGIDIKAEVLDFSISAVNEIVGASKDVAEGNADDPYIQSLKAEASDVSTAADNKDKEEDKPDTAKIEKKEPKEETSVAATTDTANQKEDTGEAVTKTEAVADKSNEAKTRTIIVLKGESLSKIAEKIYGSSHKYTLLYEANKEVLKDPNNIRVGQILKVPMLAKEEN